MIIKSSVDAPVKYKLKIELSQEEAIKLCEEIGEWNQGMWGTDWHSVMNLPKSVNAKLFMVLSDALQDLDLIPMTPNRKKGDNSYPRLRNDDVEVTQINDALGRKDED